MVLAVDLLNLELCHDMSMLPKAYIYLVAIKKNLLDSFQLSFSLRFRIDKLTNIDK